MMFYQITYDHTQNIHPDAIHSVVTTINGTLDWWHYLPNVYIIESNTLTEQIIANRIISIFPNMRFFIAKVDITATNGILPKSAWDWINAKSPLNRLLRSISTEKPKSNLPLIRSQNNTARTLNDLFASSSNKK